MIRTIAGKSGKDAITMSAQTAMIVITTVIMDNAILFLFSSFSFIRSIIFPSAFLW